ncbi:MAG: sodium:alanine symporter family protein [Aphanocapsa feldmannii 277cV]|uniref:Sodium:alanine symporter family protein n=2 Tax=Aphanocapsa feldmannii TaxID=192050 RepID=A0A524RKI6_9CHRO|nr:MAG: sodium:alanine symporter family protein [Aphanocapsa feldmannii 277cV]TGH19571.1 MAG: sodium:alanine symporter family protein [Aphanocapsa feldmannii 277cI]
MGLKNLIDGINHFAWGPPALMLITGTSLYLMLGLGFMPLRRLFYGARMVFAPSKESDGDISPFGSLSTALSATIGNGNIVGVAVAITTGGPGSVFWMWLVALVGMATKYAETVLAVCFREVDALGNRVGGPMYFLRNGVGGSLGKTLGWLYALFGAIGGLGIGNAFQSWSVAGAIKDSMGIPHLVSGVVMAALVFLVIIGGIRRIGAVSQWLMPTMSLLYVATALVILLILAPRVPAAFQLIFDDAFSGRAVAGGAIGTTIRYGIARGVFSNEVGLGTASIAHAAARTDNPVRQATVAMLGPFIDTIVICSMTALVILTTGAWQSAATGVALPLEAFNTAINGSGWIVVLVLVLFGFSTMVGWSYHCERCTEYLLGEVAIKPFRYVWVAAVVLGSVANPPIIEELLGTINGLMALPNLVGLVLLSGTVFSFTRHYAFRD